MPPSPSLFFCRLPRHGLLRLTGEDRVRFLNGQVTNDIKNLPAGNGCYTVFPNGKGKLRGDAVILNTGTALLADVQAGLDEKLAAELEKYIIADDVQIENLTSAWAAFTLIGGNAKDLLSPLGAAAPPDRLFQWKPLDAIPDALVFASRRAVPPSFDFRVPVSQAGAFEEKLAKTARDAGGIPADESTLESLRIEAGIPRFGVDMDETTLPQEAGLEALAISYSKGCYIGQEVIARIKSVGHVNRILVRLQLPASAEAGAALSWNGKEIGKLSSVTPASGPEKIGLAIVRREAAAPGAELLIGNEKAGVLP